MLPGCNRVTTGLIPADVRKTGQDPEAFNIARLDSGIRDPTAHPSESMYFGFVTMATIGYGDIITVKPYTRSLAAFIAISGQLYIATIIGILIGKLASGKSKRL